MTTCGGFLTILQARVATAKPVVDGDHGRIETRIATVSTDIDWLQEEHDWPGLAAIGKMFRVREMADKTTSETARYLLGSAMTPEQFGEATRAHWALRTGCTGGWM